MWGGEPTANASLVFFGHSQVDYYSQKGGTDKNADTRALLTCLVHNDVAARCSWKGSKGRKEPLMN